MTRSLNLSAFLLLVVVIGVAADMPAAYFVYVSPRTTQPVATPRQPVAANISRLAISVASGAVVAPMANPRLIEPKLAAPARFEGWISWAELDYGDEYVATRYPRGTLVRICAVECIVRVTTDFGPSAAIEPPRIADVAVLDWEAICHLPRGRGVCRGTVERVAIGLPQTDAEDD